MISLDDESFVHHYSMMLRILVYITSFHGRSCLVSILPLLQCMCMVTNGHANLCTYNPHMVVSIGLSDGKGMEHL